MATGMRDDEVEYFRANMRKVLHQIFLERHISCPSEYFYIWQEIRKIIEDELSNLVNIEIKDELEKIKSD